MLWVQGDSNEYPQHVCDSNEYPQHNYVFNGEL